LEREKIQITRKKGGNEKMQLFPYEGEDPSTIPKREKKKKKEGVKGKERQVVRILSGRNEGWKDQLQFHCQRGKKGKGEKKPPPSESSG